MRRKTFLSLMIGLLLTMCTAIGLSSCDYQIQKKSSGSVDSTVVAEQIEATINPSFTSVVELLQFRTQEAEAYNYDVIFRSLPDEALTNVATVCINKYGSVTKQQCVDEYLRNQAVYDNLRQSTSTEQTPEVEDRRTTISDSNLVVHATEFDTVIDGKKVRMLRFRANE